MHLIIQNLEVIIEREIPVEIRGVLHRCCNVS